MIQWTWRSPRGHRLRPLHSYWKKEYSFIYLMSSIVILCMKLPSYRISRQRMIHRNGTSCFSHIKNWIEKSPSNLCTIWKVLYSMVNICHFAWWKANLLSHQRFLWDQPKQVNTKPHTSTYHPLLLAPPRPLCLHWNKFIGLCNIPSLSNWKRFLEMGKLLPLFFNTFLTHFQKFSAKKDKIFSNLKLKSWYLNWY